MDRNKAIEHLKIVLKTCDVQDEEAVEIAIKALEETYVLNSNTLTIKVSENDIDKIKRVILDCAPWCRIFYEDGKSANVLNKEIIHCKDCVNWDTSWYTNDGNHFCPMIDMATEKNFFCKYGEER